MSLDLFFLFVTATAAFTFKSGQASRYILTPTLSGGRPAGGRTTVDTVLAALGFNLERSRS